MRAFEPDFSDIKNGIFRATIQVPEKGGSVAVDFCPPAMFRLLDVEISEGWDIEYVQLANIMLTAFRKAPWPLITPASRIMVITTPFMFMPEKTMATKEGLLTISGDIIEV